ncbi:alpha/beta-hydrolase [Microstroma glucosiphilum]|uniref:Carboxylic ester hydrolase n=1 Tax=Pseudomicrostroma glucosiphilum TaxID=1684307 RepID=A0A316UD44_9BASI|nr:alpha/beta-hydrolase [Pseudomicrostroma glucosiphilum]PWN22293.1 alpha/beta-hydrolase [Pseudomicrostroma glucosiphilum]
MHGNFKGCLLAACLALWLSLSLSSHGVLAKHSSSSASTPLATLSSGATLQGVTDEANYLSYWEGVRYAKAPVGDLRFAPPQMIDLATQNTPAPATSSSSGGHSENGAAHLLNPLHHFKLAAQLAQKAFHASHQKVGRSVQVIQKRWSEFSTPALRRANAATVVANVTGPICPQAGDIGDQSEDCLFINIYKPYNASSSTPLPVLLFVHGGGFQNGAGSFYDPTPIIKSGLRFGQPVIVATINYRLNIFGFSSSSDLATLAGLNPSGCTASATGCTTQNLPGEPVGINLGYQDIKMAVNWTNTNIAAFGGDPQQVTIWGQSAGSFGVSAQLLGHQGQALGGDAQQPTNPPRPLFRGAIMMSGAPSGPAIPEPAHQDDVWNVTLSDAGCGGDSYQTAQARLNCIRGADWTVLRTSANNRNDRSGDPGHYYLGNYPFLPTFDGGARRGGFLARPPSETLSAGAFASVPIMIGDVEDEGTIFAPRDLGNSSSLEDWFRGVYFADGTATMQNNVMDEVLNAYPDIPQEGSPFTPRTGGDTNRYFGHTNQFKRAAALYGDIRFQSNRRNLLWQGLATGNTPAAWTWLYSCPSYKESVSLGVAHSDDLNALYSVAGDQRHPSPFQSLMSRQWISFATNLDPAAEPGLPAWPQYDLDAVQMMSYGANGKTSIIADDYRASAMAVLNTTDVLEVTHR